VSERPRQRREADARGVTPRDPWAPGTRMGPKTTRRPRWDPTAPLGFMGPHTPLHKPPLAKQDFVGLPTNERLPRRQQRAESGRRACGAMGQRTKSLRDSPLRGRKSREAAASREESDGEWTRSPRSTSLLLQRSTLDQAHQVDLRPVSDAAMARCWNDKIGLDE
jgi:hypothetical protein